MRTSATWADRSSILAGEGSTLIDVPRRRAARRAVVRRIRAFPSGQAVVLRGRGGAVRAVAHASGVRVARELIALPSAERPAYLIEDDGAPLALVCRDILSVPPGLTRLAVPAQAMLRIGAAVARFGPARHLLRSRIAVGWRS